MALRLAAEAGVFPAPLDDSKFVHALQRGHISFVVSDALKADHPIMYASPGFYELTGPLATSVLTPQATTSLRSSEGTVASCKAPKRTRSPSCRSGRQSRKAARRR
jgi:hypothetical protein